MKKKNDDLAAEEEVNFQKVRTFQSVEEKIAALREAAIGHAFVIRRDDGSKDVVDAITAGVIVKVYDNINDQNRVKYGAMSIEMMAGIAWKMVERGTIAVSFGNR